MINALPIVGWLLSALFTFGLAVPLWFFWTFFGLGRTYFYFLPEVYLSVPFFSVFGLLVIVSILRGMLLPKFNINNK